MNKFEFVSCRRRVSKVLFAAAAYMMLQPVNAQQLYSATPPPGSSFIRVTNGTPTAGVAARVGAQVLPALPPYSSSSYLFLPPGDVAVSLADVEKTYTVAADHYYTVAHTADGQKVFDLKGLTSQLKSMVVLFNLLPDTTLSLKTADGKTTVFENVAPYTAVQREINPLSVQLALFRGTEKIANVPLKAFERGQPASLVVAGSANAPTAAWDLQQ